MLHAAPGYSGFNEYRKSANGLYKYPCLADKTLSGYVSVYMHAFDYIIIYIYK